MKVKEIDMAQGRAGILFVTDVKFWLKRHGSHMRIALLWNHLSDKIVTPSLFFVGRLDRSDRRCLKSISDNARIYCLNSHLGIPGQTFREPFFKSTFARVWSLMRLLIWRTKQCLRRGRQTSAVNSAATVGLSYFRLPAQVDFFQKVCAFEQPDVIMVEYVRLAYLVEDMESTELKQTLTVIDTIDVMHERGQRIEKAGMSVPFKITIEEEAEALKPFDVVMAIQSKDAEKLQAMLPAGNVITVPYSCELRLSDKSPEEKCAIMYAAGGDVCNLHALEGFLKEVWPNLRSKWDNRVCLDVYGDIATHIPVEMNDQGIRVHGYVDDIEAAYDSADIIVNPVMIGGGLKIKNVEALCRGKALVTTSIGAEGLEDGIETAFRVCDQSDAMVKELNGLVESAARRRNLAASAFLFAQNHFTEEKAYAELDEALRIHIEC